MRHFAHLLDQLSYEPQRTAKLRLITDYLARTPDPDRGYALAALTGDLNLAHAKPALIRALIETRVDPALFRLSYDYVGDLSETVALIWPTREGLREVPPSLAELVARLRQAGKADLPRLLADLLDNLTETQRWALLKLMTGGLRVGVSARLAKTAAAALGGRDIRQIDELWHGLEPPYETLFAWLEGSAPRPVSNDPAPFRPAMLSHAINEADFAKLDPAQFLAEWKWDGIRVQAVCARDSHGKFVRRLYSRTGDDISATFPDILDELTFDAAIDGELLIMRQGAVQPFADLQQRLNRKSVTAKIMKAFPAHIRAYDLLVLNGKDLRDTPFATRRRHLEKFITDLNAPIIDLSQLIPFKTWDELAAARADPAHAGAGADANAVEGCMIKRGEAPYLGGRPKGQWYKWKRDPYLIDAVLMYAQRGHGKRSSLYSDYTFGVWQKTASGAELVPVGKAYFGFTDDELQAIDRFVRHNTVNRFGPVREVNHTASQGLVLEIAFEGLNRSPRHKSGLAMRFPRIARLRWDKAPAEADTLDTLAALLEHVSPKQVSPSV